MSSPNYGLVHYACEITFLHLRHGTKYVIQFQIQSGVELTEALAAIQARRAGTLLFEQEIRERYRGQEFMNDYGFLAVTAKLVTRDPENSEGIIPKPTHEVE